MTARDELATLRNDLSTKGGAAVRVLQVTDDPDVSAGDVAKVIATDPMFAAQVLRSANSSYYGLSGRVSSLPFAVSVMGFSALRSLAVVTAGRLNREGASPDGFWQAATLTATAAEMVAPSLAVEPGEAFSVGLLHLMGSALLYQASTVAGRTTPRSRPGRRDESDSPGVTLCLPLATDPDTLLIAEADGFGVGHDVLVAQVLEGWRFPAGITEAIARHHEPVLPDSPPLRRVLQIARSVADTVLVSEVLADVDADDSAVGVTMTPEAERMCAWLSEGAIGRIEAEALAVRTRHRAAELLASLRP